MISASLSLASRASPAPWFAASCVALLYDNTCMSMPCASISAIRPAPASASFAMIWRVGAIIGRSSDMAGGLSPTPRSAM